MSSAAHTTPPAPSPAPGTIRRRTVAVSDPASANSSSSSEPPTVSASPTTSPYLSPQTPPFRPTYSRTSTDSNNGSGSGGSSPRFDLPDTDPFLSGFSLLDLLNVVDAHLELFTRPLRRKSVTWREKADKLLDEAKAKARETRVNLLPEVPAFDLGAELETTSRKVLTQKDRERLERKYREVRGKTKDSVAKLMVKWEEEKTVRLRDKISFVCGVMNVLISALLLGFHPTWIPAYYSLQMLFYTPLRVYTYKKRLYHYFLFDLCYAVNVLCLVYLWILPGNTILFEACYGLTLGSLGTAIVTWRNSLVFHSLDKVISLAIHIFPPFVFTVIRHFYPEDLAIERYPALKELKHLRPWRSVAICMAFYTLWQLLYFHFVVQLRAEKIKEGRATSFTFMINDRKRLIGKIAAKVPPQLREAAFMVGQALYTFVTLLVPVFVLYDSKFWSSVYLLLLFGASAFNGASFYVEVFSRRFEKDLLNLRKEFDAQQALLARYAANPAGIPATPGAALTPVSDPLAAAGETGSVPKLELDGVKEERGAEKEEGEGEGKKEKGRTGTVGEELGRVETPNMEG